MPSIPWLRASGLVVAVLCLPACKSDSDTPGPRFEPKGPLLRLETGKGACEGAAERVKHNIESSTRLKLSSHR